MHSNLSCFCCILSYCECYSFARFIKLSIHRWIGFVFLSKSHRKVRLGNEILFFPFVSQSIKLKQTVRFVALNLRCPMVCMVVRNPIPLLPISFHYLVDCRLRFGYISLFSYFFFLFHIRICIWHPMLHWITETKVLKWYEAWKKSNESKVRHTLYTDTHNIQPHRNQYHPYVVVVI